MKTDKELEAIYNSGKDVVMEHLRMLFVLVDKVEALEAEVVSLKEQLHKNSQNSSKPPSTDGYKKPVKKNRSLRKKSDKKSGGQPNHTGHTLNSVATPDTIITLPLPSACSCGCDLSSLPSIGLRKRQVFDIPLPKVEVTEYHSFGTCCPQCNKENYSSFPDTVTHKTQYGSRINSLALYLRGYQYLPLKRLSEFFKDVFSLPISEGTLVNMSASGATKLAPVVADIESHLLHSEVVHFDETGVSVNGILHWVHSAGTDLYTSYCAHAKRGCEAIDAMGILPYYKGISVHDHWKPYFTYTTTNHALCNAHHLRELQAFSETGNHSWADKLQNLLLEMKRYSEKDTYLLSPKMITQYEVEYDTIIAKAMEQNPPPERPKGKKGRPAKGKVNSFLSRFRDFKTEVLRFLHNPLVPFDNNLAERDVRMVKVQQKISGTYKTIEKANEFLTIRSVISTIKKHNESVFKALEQVGKVESLEEMLQAIAE